MLCSKLVTVQGKKPWSVVAMVLKGSQETSTKMIDITTNVSGMEGKTSQDSVEQDSQGIIFKQV